jgi:GT2 family glycosyltransferase
MTEAFPKYDVILTVWNRVGYTKRTVAYLINSGAIESCERFIIVDNRSTEEGMDEFLLDMYTNMPNVSHKVSLVRRHQNDGWGKAVNDALGLSRAPFVLLVNNDVELHEDAITESFKTFENQSNIGILALWRHIHHGFVEGGVMNEYFREMDNVPAVAWLMPKEAMEKVGLLPEHGPCMTKGGNGEDTAYVNRMKDAGYLVGVPGGNLAEHIDGY